jgi:hypothetical protein
MIMLDDKRLQEEYIMPTTSVRQMTQADFPGQKLYPIIPGKLHMGIRPGVLKNTTQDEIDRILMTPQTQGFHYLGRSEVRDSA